MKQGIAPASRHSVINLYVLTAVAFEQQVMVVYRLPRRGAALMGRCRRGSRRFRQSRRRASQHGRSELPAAVRQRLAEAANAVNAAGLVLPKPVAEHTADALGKVPVKVDG